VKKLSNTCPFKWTMRTTGDTRSRPTLIPMISWLGFAKVFVAVRSHLPGVKLTAEVAKALARDYLTEVGWFGEESLEADFVF
jgi:hypothetical protein